MGNTVTVEHWDGNIGMKEHIGFEISGWWNMWIERTMTGIRIETSGRVNIYIGRKTSYGGIQEWKY